MATYYVGIGGNDANAGTSWALRKLTINGAEDIPVAAGDTVYVGPGTYRESLTVDVSGSAGNIITYIGDYTGANTSGTKGVVRITGSADDIALTRANCITGSSKNYRTFRGFVVDLTSGNPVDLTTCDHWIIEQCHITRATGTNSGAIDGNYLNTNHTIRNCRIESTGSGISFGAISVAADNSGILIESCYIHSYGSAAQYGIRFWGVGGATVRNCTIVGGASQGGVRSISLNTGQTLTVNNCVICGCQYGLYSDSTAKLTEDYNTIFSCSTARVTVTAGANSVARPPLFDTRWFFEMVNGGTMVTPWDLASYSTLVEYNSGTGAPSTDIRGASAVGTYREWGAVEYDSTLDIEAAAGGGAAGIITHAGMSGGMRG